MKLTGVVPLEKQLGLVAATATRTVARRSSDRESCIICYVA